MHSATFNYTTFRHEKNEEAEKLQMKKFLKIATIGISVCFMFGVTAWAFDADRHFMGNDHDTLLIGEIISMNEKEMVVQGIDHLVSAHDLVEGAGQTQLRPERVNIVKDTRMAHFQIGDHVVASLNQEGDLFVVAWGIYRLVPVASLDFQLWYVETNYTLRSIILSDFVNQGGRYTYSVSDGRVIRHQQDAEIIIYDPELPQEIQPRVEVNAVELEEPETSSRAPIFIILGMTGLVLIGLGGWLIYHKQGNR